MKLIVGLGNPGKEYEHTRHNMGFDALDKLSETLKIDINKNRFKGIYGKGKYKDKDIILLKPLTFMNLSGEAVVEIMHYFKIDINDLLIIVDDMALPVGKIRLRPKGSDGGHNGIKNIILNLNSDQFKRVKIGISHPLNNTIDYVLSKPSKEELNLILPAISKTVDSIIDYLDFGFEHSMSKFN